MNYNWRSVKKSNENLDGDPYLNHANRLKATIKQQYKSLCSSFQQHQTNIQEALADLIAMLKKTLAKNQKLKKEIRRLKRMRAINPNDVNSQNEDMSLSQSTFKEEEEQEEFQSFQKHIHKPQGQLKPQPQTKPKAPLRKKRKRKGLPIKEKQQLRGQYPFMSDFIRNYLAPKLQMDYNSFIYKRSFVNIYMRWNQQRKRICPILNHSLIQMRLTVEVKELFPESVVSNRYFKGLKFKNQYANLQTISDIIYEEKVKINEDDIFQGEGNFNFDQSQK